MLLTLLYLKQYIYLFKVGVSKSLPDFLADGAAHSQTADGTSAGQSPEWETDRLRQELELCRRHLDEQTRRADGLQRELEVARNKEHEYTQNLARTLEQVEENLKRSNVIIIFSFYRDSFIKLK